MTFVRTAPYLPYTHYKFLFFSEIVVHTSLTYLQRYTSRKYSSHSSSQDVTSKEVFTSLKRTNPTGRASLLDATYNIHHQQSTILQLDGNHGINDQNGSLEQKISNQLLGKLKRRKQRNGCSRDHQCSIQNTRIPDPSEVSQNHLTDDQRTSLFVVLKSKTQLFKADPGH